MPVLDALFDHIHQISSDVEIRGGLLQRSPTPAIDVRVGQTRSIDDLGRVSGLPESGHRWAVYEYTPYSFAFNCASFAAMKARMSSAISSSFSHCSL